MAIPFIANSVCASKVGLSRIGLARRDGMTSSVWSACVIATLSIGRRPLREGLTTDVAVELGVEVGLGAHACSSRRKKWQRASFYELRAGFKKRHIIIQVV